MGLVRGAVVEKAYEIMGSMISIAAFALFAPALYTPDAVCLLDREQGLLFTGDTYYPGPIYLFGPGTDLEAYGTSVRRIAELAPQVKIVLGAHNVPTALPSILPQLVSAFEAVRAGKIRPAEASSGRVLYKVGEISFRMKP